MKKNTYVITLSKIFPKTHIKSGKETSFDLKFALGLANVIGGKFHTIRANYEL